MRPVFEKGPITFSLTNKAGLGGLNGIKEGVLVEPDTANSGRIKPTGAGSPKVLGVAIGNASASDFLNTDTTDDWGNNVTNFNYPPNEVAVAYQGVWLLTASANILFGELVISAANGQVAPNGAGTNALVVIGRCVEPNGITAGNKGKILLGGVGA